MPFSGGKVNKGTNLPTSLYLPVPYQTIPSYLPHLSVFRIRIRIIESLLNVDPDPNGQIWIRIQELKSSDLKLKIAATYRS